MSIPYMQPIVFTYSGKTRKFCEASARAHVTVECVFCRRYSIPCRLCMRLRRQTPFSASGYFLSISPMRIQVYVDLRSQRICFSVTLHNVGLFREAHRETEAGAVHLHDHAAVRGDKLSYLPVKKALLNRHGLATHWSCRHSGCWSALGPGARPSPPERPHASWTRIHGCGLAMAFTSLSASVSRSR